MVELKQIKRLLSGLLALCLCLSLVPVYSEAATVAPTANAGRFTIESSSATVHPGDTVSVTISLKNNTTGFGGMAFDVYFDDEVLKLTGCEKDLGSNICTSSKIGRWPNRMNFQYAGIDNVEGDGVLATLTFEAVGSAPSNTSIEIVPEDGTFFYYTEDYDEVDIEAVAVASGAVSVVDHNYISVVTAPNCTERGYTTHTCTICGESYVDSYVEPAGHQYTYEVTKTPTTSTVGTLNGICSVCGDTTTVTLPKLNTTDYTYTVEQKPTYFRAGLSRYTWKNTSYGTFSFEIVSDKLIPDASTPTFVVGTGKGFEGNTVSVTISMKNNPGFGGIGYTVHYNHELLSLESYELGLGGNICTPSKMNATAGQMMFLYAGIENVTGDGVLVTLNFKIKEGAQTGFTDITVVSDDASSFRYDGNNHEVDFYLAGENGGIEIVDYTPGDISGDGKINNRDAARLMQYLAGWDVDLVEAALDVNGDGKVNNRDAARLMQYLAGWDVTIN